MSFSIRVTGLLIILPSIAENQMEQTMNMRYEVATWFAQALSHHSGRYRIFTPYPPKPEALNPSTYVHTVLSICVNLAVIINPQRPLLLLLLGSHGFRL